MCVLFWHLLNNQQDYAYSMPTVTAKKLRKVEWRDPLSSVRCVWESFRPC